MTPVDRSAAGASIVAAGRRALALALLALGACGGGEDAPPAAPQEPAPEEAPAEPAPAEPAPGPEQPALPRSEAEVVELHEGETEDGARFWLGRYVVRGDAPVERPEAELQLLDEAGEIVGRLRAQAASARLAPGEAAPVVFESPRPPAHVRVAARAIDPTPPSSVAREVFALEARDVEVREGTARGALANATEHVGHPIFAWLEGWKGERLVAFGRGFPPRERLGPGEATELELSARWVLEPPERWVVHGQTRVAGPLTTAE